RPGEAHAAGAPRRATVLHRLLDELARLAGGHVVEPEVPPAAPVREVRQPPAVRREARLDGCYWLADAVVPAVHDPALAIRRQQPDPAGVPGHVRDAPLLPGQRAVRRPG